MLLSSLRSFISSTSHSMSFDAALKLAVKIRSTANYVATAGNLLIRRASSKDLDFVTRQAIMEGRPIGPYDNPSAFAFNPQGFLVGEINGKLIGCINSITYPNHHSSMGGILVTEQYRRKGYGQKLLTTSFKSLDKNYTIGGDAMSVLKPALQSLGFETFWNTYIAMLSLDRVARILSKIENPSGIVIQQIHKVNSVKLFEYDSMVFGASRKIFIKTLMTAPGNFGWVAVNQATDNTIVGYSILRPVIRGGGTEIGLSIAPLFADNVDIAMLLLKTAAENCLANEATPKTKLQVFHPVGDNCGEDSSQLMRELEAELTHIAFRMYTKGIPIGRQTKKIYGIASPAFD